MFWYVMWGREQVKDTAWIWQGYQEREWELEKLLGNEIGKCQTKTEWEGLKGETESFVENI